MARGYIAGGNSGADSSDDCTAAKSEVLSGKKAITQDSNDEVVSGTMPNNSTRSSNGAVPGISSSYADVPTREAETSLQLNIDTSGTKRISMCPPRGYYPGGGTSYINRPASEFGDAQTMHVVRGKRFTSQNGVNTPGDMVDRGTNQYGGFGEGGDYYAINTLPEGWYHSDGNAWAPEARCSKDTIRNYLGVKAEIIRSGNSIAGIAGTLAIQSAINFNAAAISGDTIRISWTNPSKGPWQGVFIQISTDGYPGTGGGTRAYTGAGNNTGAGAWNYIDITGLNPQTTYYFTCTSYCDALGWGSSWNVSATTDVSTPDIFQKTSTYAWQSWCVNASDSYEKYLYVDVKFGKNKIYFCATEITSMGDNMMSFAEGDGLNLPYIAFSSLDTNKLNALHGYKALMYLDSTNDLKKTWNSGEWSVKARKYLSGYDTQIYLPGSGGIINDIGCGVGSSAKTFRLEFVK